MLDISLNGESLRSGTLAGDEHIGIDLVDGSNLLVLRHHSKRFGEGRIWDTKSKDGIILEDRRIELRSIAIDGIEFKDKLHKFRFEQEPVPGEPKAPQDWEGDFNFNGAVSLDISPTPLNWLINLRLKQPRNHSISYFSDHTKLFHYEDDLELIQAIEDLLKDMP
jgi:hypothetical protein